MGMRGHLWGAGDRTQWAACEETPYLLLSDGSSPESFQNGMGHFEDCPGKLTRSDYLYLMKLLEMFTNRQQKGQRWSTHLACSRGLVC